MPNYHAPSRTRIAAAAGLLFLAAGCAHQAAPEPEPVAPVQTAVARRSPMQRIIQARGILHPLDQASLLPKINAPIQEFYVNRGDHVRKGQLLALLENKDLAAAVADTKGQYEQAQASYRVTTAASMPEELQKARAEVQSSKEALDAAQKMLDSRRDLLQQGALSRRQVDEANVAHVQARSQHEIAAKHLDSLEKIGQEAQTKEAQAQLDAAKGRYQGAEAQLSYSRITSPIDGVITERPLYAGEMAGAGSPMLTVMNIASVIARTNVPADQIRYVKAGNPATIASSDSAAELRGKVTVVSPALDPNSTTAEVWVQAFNPGERLKPGASVQVSIVAETIQDAIVIPLAALLPAEQGASMVMVVGADSLAHQREIEAGIREAGKVQVLKGLDPGEQVIVVGGLGLDDKAKVRVEKPGGKGDEKTDTKTDEKSDQHD